MGDNRLPRAVQPGRGNTPALVAGSGRPRLLFVSPVVPALTGNGLAMRAGATLRALARRFRVTLLVAPHYGAPGAELPEEIAAVCERVVRVSAGDRLPTRRHFAVVHVYGLAAWPDAAPWLRRAAERHLDLPDLESVTQRRLLMLARETGRDEAARRAESNAAQARALEDSAQSQFDRIYVSSTIDRQTLLKRDGGRAEVIVLPNTLPIPPITPFPPPDRGSFVLLFVGTLGYAPNEDAMQYFTASILPRIQAGADRPVTLRIVGIGAGPAVRRLDGQAGVEVIGEVDDIAPWYRDAHLAVVPLRAGGGTRIKILEAFARRRPVVTTTLGIEGIAVEDGRHAFIADEPAPFATACLRLLNDPPFAEAMAAEAFSLFSQSYSDETLARIVAEAAAAEPHRERQGGGRR
jgi:glycosyltransferase involved in cell wall biosynthesis